MLMPAQIRRHPVAAAVFGVALVAAVLFAVRLALFAPHFRGELQRDAPIAGWMTPGYVAMSWHVPKPLVMEAAGLAGRGAARISLDDIAEKKGVALAELTRAIEDRIAAFRAEER